MVEEPMLIERITKMDKVLEEGISSLRWKSKEVNVFITKAHVVVEEIYKIVNKIKEDLGKIKEILAEMNKTMIERKNKLVYPEEFYTTH